MKPQYNKLVVVALLLALIALFLPEAIEPDIAFEYVGNNTDLCDFNHTSMLCNGTRQLDTIYWANETPIVLNVFAHANSAGQTAAVFIYRNGVLYSPQAGRPLAAPEQTWRDPGSVTIPKGWNYSVNVTNYHHFEWREDRILSGKNGTLSINQTFTGCVGDCSFDTIYVNSINVNNTPSGHINLLVPFNSVLGAIETTLDTQGRFSFLLTNTSSGTGAEFDLNDGNLHIEITDGSNNFFDMFNSNTTIDVNGTRYNYNQTDFDMGGANLTNCSNCGGNQNLNEVLAVGNTATSQNINITNGTLYINNLSVDKLMFHYVVPANTTWVNISGLNISRDGFYDVTSQLTCRNATNLKLYVNNDINDTNYTRQFVYADNAAMISARQNDAGVSACAQGLASTGKQRIILDSYGKTHYISEVGLETGGTLIFFNGMYSYDRSITNITTLNFRSDSGANIGYGSEFWIYRS